MHDQKKATLAETITVVDSSTDPRKEREPMCNDAFNEQSSDIYSKLEFHETRKTQIHGKKQEQGDETRMCRGVVKVNKVLTLEIDIPILRDPIANLETCPPALVVYSS